MAIPRRLPKLATPSGRVLVIAPTLLGYVIMALGIPLPLRAASKPPAATQVRVCCCRGCDHSKKKCCCCGSDEDAPSGPVAVSSPPRPSQQEGQAAGTMTWQVYIAAPSCDQAAKLWLMDNPISVPASPWTWQVALHSLGCLPPVNDSAFALIISPPSPPPRG